MGRYTMTQLESSKKKYHDVIVNIRGQGLLIAVEFFQASLVKKITDSALEAGLILNINQMKNIRIFPALNIKKEEIAQGIAILDRAIANNV